MLLDFLKKFTEDKTSPWKLVYDQFKPAQEGLREALCALGNGYMVTRGAAPESKASRIHYPGTYMAGIYNTLGTNISGRTVYNEDLVNCPNWLCIEWRVDGGEWRTLENSKILMYRQELDMKRGLLVRKIRLRDGRGRCTLIETQCMVNMASAHQAALRYTIMPENYEGLVTLRARLDGSVQNKGVPRYSELNSKHLKVHATGSFGKNGIYLEARTRQSEKVIAQAARVFLFSEGKELRSARRSVIEEKKAVSQQFDFEVRKRKKYTIEKIVAVFTSQDRGVRNPLSAAIKFVKSPGRFDDYYKTHRNAWDILWKNFDIHIDGDPFAQRIMRLHTFHLLQTGSIHTTMLDVGMPARGLHGEAYRGHIFWDELFIFPLFDFHVPEITKGLLSYRYRRLPQAREYAAKNGYKGAMFPWQSGSSGHEETQVLHLNPVSGTWGPDHSCIQRHVSFAIAYNVWNYWKHSQDMEFLARRGAELILSIAQFAASLVFYDERDGRYHTEGLMGPDEFHEKLPDSDKPGFRDNAYSNLLIVWVLMRAHELLQVLPSQTKTLLLKKLNILPDDLSVWNEISRKMNIIIDQDGIISQFDGYFQLKELNWDKYRAQYGNIQRMDRILKAEGKVPDEYKVAKQADVLMIFYLLNVEEVRALFKQLGYKFDKTMLRKNYEYYLKRTSHGSTLSKIAHCYIAHILGRSRESWQWFQEVLKSDVFDTQGGTTREGIHAGVMAASVYMIMRAFVGIQIMNDCIRITPTLPKQWRSVRFGFRFQGRWISLMVSHKEMAILVRGPRSKQFDIPFEIYGKKYFFFFGKSYTISLEKQSIGEAL